jgi:uncharacterized hydrophobic protein (TIGR00271 family)
MKILLVVTNAEMAKRSVPWLAKTAASHKAEFLATNCVPNPVAVPGREFAWPLIENSKVVRSALEDAIDLLDESKVTLLDEINGEVPSEAVSALVRKLGINIIYFPVDARLNPSTPYLQFGQRLLQNAPCDVMMLDLGAADREKIKRVIVPMDLATSGHAIRHIIKVSSNEGIIVPLHISPDFGADSRKIADKELDLQLQEIGVRQASANLNPQVVIADGFTEGILQTVRANDSILMGGSSVKLIHDMRQELITLRPMIADTIAMGVFRPGELAAKTVVGRIGRRLKTAMPELTLADRIALFDRIQGGARLTPDFTIMIGLSVVIASCGLMADNASVVIGAMLVAPFMTSLVGIGLALAQGNLALMKRSGLAMGAGLLVGLVLSFVLGWLVPMDELPLEVLARGDPDLVDLAIAFVSGMAAAYAVSRVSVAESIVGVAIAAALVPPLSCIGIMVANGYVLEAEGTTILLITNLAAIALGAAFTFRWLGVPGTRTGHRSYVQIRWISTALIVLVLVLSIPLGYKMAGRLVVGQIRPMSFRVSTAVKEVVDARIELEEGLSIMWMGRSGSGMSRRIRILLMSDWPVSNDVVQDITAAIQATIGKDTPVEIGVFLNVVVNRDAPEPPAQK